MSKIGYKLKAKIYTLEDEFLQEIKCKKNTKRNETTSFIGSGQLSQGQTLEIATKDKLLKTIKAGEARCLLNGVFYLITGIFTKDSTPIYNKNRQLEDTILSLQ